MEELRERWAREVEEDEEGGREALGVAPAGEGDWICLSAFSGEDLTRDFRGVFEREVGMEVRWSLAEETGVMGLAEETGVWLFGKEVRA